MKIEKITKTGKKYKIVFENDEKITTYDDVIINNGLLYHPNVDLDLLNKINKDTSYYDIYYKTINYITRKLRSEQEIIKFIDKYNVNEKDKKTVINKLKKIELINDLNFTKAYISDHIYLSNDGPHKIKNNLLQHNILEEIIDEQLNKIEENIIIEKLKKLMKKKIKSSKYTGYYLKRKVINDFTNLGYEQSMIIEIFDNIDVDNNNLLKKDYEKIFKKLSIKYSKDKLNFKIRNRLYQKGYTVDEIDNILK